MSVRKNENRIGISETGAADAAAAVVATDQQSGGNGTLNFVCPTEMVELPSQGRFYSESHPLYGQEHIEIKHMTAREEDLLTSRSLLKKGTALDRLLDSVIMDKRIKSESLLIGDKNAVLIATRISGYGNEYTTTVGCPSCGEQSTYEFDLEEQNMTHGGVEAVEEDAGVSDTNGDFHIVLPVTGWDVVVTPMTGREEKALARSIEGRKKKKMPEDMLTTQLQLFIDSINGTDDRATINKAVFMMPAKDSRHLRNIYQELMPNVDLTQHFTCEECDYSGQMEVPFTTDFFWPKR